MKSKIIVLFLIVFLSACASKDTLDMHIDSLPPTASGELPAELQFWSNISGTAVRGLTRNSKYPHNADSSEGITLIDFPDSKGDKYGQRISGLLTPPESGNYVFYVSADDSAEVWLSSDDRPVNKSLIALVNKASGYKVFDRYASQKSRAIRLEEGVQYYLEIFHKENTGSDYLNVSWQGPSFEIATLSHEHYKAYQHDVLGENTYQVGYHAGYESGRYLVPYDLTYPTPDSDGDGLPDFYEQIIGLDINDPSDALSDVDQDLLTALDEYYLRTSPHNSDSDNDGLPDGFEALHELNPNDANDALGDLDGDGVSNVDEYLAGSLLNDSNDVPSLPSEPVVLDQGNAVYLSWSIPDSRADGSPLELYEIKEYRIYAGSTTTNLVVKAVITDPTVTNATVNISGEEVFFKISTVSTDGLESNKSAIIDIRQTQTNTADTADSSSETSTSGTASTSGSQISTETIDTTIVLDSSDATGTSGAGSSSAGSDSEVSAETSTPEVSTDYADTTPSGEVNTSNEPATSVTASSYSNIEEDTSHWLHTGSGNSLSEDTSAFSFSNGLIRSESSGVNIHSHYTQTASKGACYYTGKMMLTTSDSSAGLGVTFASDYPNSDSYYRLRFSPGGNFHVSPHNATVTGDIDSGVKPVSGKWYQFEIQWVNDGQGTSIRARVWDESSAKPDDWQVDAIDSSGKFSACNVGIWSMYGVGNQWDALSFGQVMEATSEASSNQTLANLEDDQAGWFHTGAGNSLNEDVSTFENANGLISSKTSGVNIHSHYIALDPIANSCIYSGKMKLSTTSSGAGLGVTFASDYPNSDSYYRLRVEPGKAFHISPHNATVSGDTDSGVKATAGTWYRFQVKWENNGSSTAIMASVWQDGTSQPTDWQINAIDGEGSFSNCKVGVWSMFADQNQWDELSVSY